MSNKYDEPPAYPGAPQAPATAYHGGGDFNQQQYNHAYGSPPPQGGYGSPPPQGYYQPQPQMGYHQQGPYPPQQQGYYPQQGGYYQQPNQRRSPGCLEGLLAALACCCCLDLLF